MEIDIERLEFLSKLKLTEDEKQSFETQLSTVLAFLSEIGKVEIPSALEKREAITLSNLREDEPVSEYTREEILANATKQKYGCFSTPLVVE